MRRALVVAWACALTVAMSTAVVYAKNECTATCAAKKKDAIKAAVTEFKTCKSSAADKTAKAACKTAKKAAIKAANDAFKTAKTTCKDDKTSTICASPSGAFLAD